MYVSVFHCSYVSVTVCASYCLVPRPPIFVNVSYTVMYPLAEVELMECKFELKQTTCWCRSTRKSAYNVDGGNVDDMVQDRARFPIPNTPHSSTCYMMCHQCYSSHVACI